MLPKNSLETRGGRLATFSLLYLTEGIPFGFSAFALTTYLRQQGVGLTEIGAFTAMLYLPWGFKWLGGPIVDLVRIQRFGPRRFWIAGAQMFMILTLALIWLVKPEANLGLLTTLIFVHNIFAATQDIAIDALAVQVLPEHERGMANGFMFGAAYMGQLIGGSGALFIAGAFGFGATYPFVCGLLLLVLLTVTLRLNEPPPLATAAVSQATGMVSQVAYRLGKYLMDLMRGFFLSGRGPVLGVVFGLMPFGAVALGLALGSTMQVDLGMDENQIAILGIWTGIAGALGCVAGGWISDRLGHRKSLAVWFIVTTLPTFYLSGKFSGASGMEGVTIDTYWVTAIIYTFTSGLISGTSMAVFMGLTSPIVAATQFTGYMAMRNLVYAYSANWQGAMADAQGYAATLRLDAVIAFIPLLAIVFLKPAEPKPLAGLPAAHHLRKYAAVFVLLAPLAMTFGGDWRSPDANLLAFWAVALVGLMVLAAPGGARNGVRMVGMVATAAVLLFAWRWAEAGWGRLAQLSLLGAAFAVAAAGLTLGARHEERKEASADR